MDSKDIARFWRCADVREGCWGWRRRPNNKGYAIIRIQGRLMLASRVSWEIKYGTPPPDHLLVLHSCDNPICTNWEHLFLGTHADNTADARAKDRLRRGPFTDEHKARIREGMASLRKISDEDVLQIRKLYAEGQTQAAIAKLFPVGQKMISLIVLGRRYTTLGGPQGKIDRESINAKITASKLGRKLSPEHRAKIAAAHRGLKQSDEQRQRHAEKMKELWKAGKFNAEHTPEQREANAAKHRELWASGAYANRKPKGLA